MRQLKLLQCTAFVVPGWGQFLSVNSYHTFSNNSSKNEPICNYDKMIRIL